MPESPLPEPQAPRLIVTADDLGLTTEINQGILKAHTQGLVRSAALLANGKATAEALRLCRAHPHLEIGVHLGIVEGYALSGRRSSLTDPLSYFGDGRPCLHRGWPWFLRRYCRGAIDLAELEAELDLQITRLRDSVGALAFANGTQHLHLLPSVLSVVLKLLAKHGIPALRLPVRSLRTPGWRRRGLVNSALAALGRRAAPATVAAGVRHTQAFAGFDACGQLDHASLAAILGALPPTTVELMTHPGEDCAWLREQLPWAYGTFGWSGELAALCGDGAKAQIRARGIELIQFKDLPTTAEGQ